MSDHRSIDLSAAAVDRVKVKRTIGVFTGLALNIGMMVGSGIFITPKAVIMNTGSPGLSLIVWFLCGLISLGGSLCFAELATSIQISGGSWAYIMTAFGPAPAFAYAFIMLMRQAMSAALIVLASANYILDPFFGGCPPPTILKKLLGLCLITLVLYINVFTSAVSRVLRYLLVVKVITIITIVIGGLFWSVRYGAAHLENSFDDTTSNGLGVALSFYGGLYAFSGWHNIVQVTEEIKNPKRSVPIAAVLSVTMVTVLYLLLNISYYIVIGHKEVLTSDAVVLDWAQAIFGQWGVVFSFLVAASALGSAIASSFGISRQLMALAREGHTAQLLAMVDLESGAPTMSLVFRGVLMFIFVLSSNVNQLLSIISFAIWVGFGLSFAAQVWLKKRGYNDNMDVFKVPMVLPVIMILVSAYLVIIPVISAPSLDFLYGVVISLTGLILYFPFIWFKNRVNCFDGVTMTCQRLFRVALPQK